MNARGEKLTWKRLNTHWGATPNGADLEVRVEGKDVVLRFDYTTTERAWKSADPDSRLELVFRNCSVYRLGPENMDSFYMHKSRYSDSGMEWGEFYEVCDAGSAEAFASDGIVVAADPVAAELRHFVFFERDATFECMAVDFTLRRAVI